MPIISKLLKVSIVCLFILFVTVSYGQATALKHDLQKIRYFLQFLQFTNGLTNFSFYSEDFLNTNFDVYKGNRYINNFCNTQDRFYIIDERQDNYNLLVKNGFGYTREQIAIINDKLNLLGLEIEFLKNLDVYQPFGYGEKIQSGGNTINEFETQGLPKMFKRLSPVFKKVFGVNPNQKQHKERLEGLIQMFVEKYSHRFNYYDQEGIKQNGDYHKDECLGGLAAITKKYDSVVKGYSELGDVAQNSVGKEWTKLMKTVKKVLEHHQRGFFNEAVSR